MLPWPAATSCETGMSVEIDFHFTQKAHGITPGARLRVIGA